MKTQNTYFGKAMRVFAALVLTGLLTMQLASAQWYNTGWLYRVPITIINSGGTLTNFQVQVSLGSSFAWNHTRPNGADVRVTTSDMVTPVDFWIESWNSGTSASIWVEVPSVAASPSNTTLYLYYGNSLASSASNGDQTFEFFDDFASGSIDGTKWTTEGTPTVAVVPDNGNNVLSITGPYQQHYNYLESQDRSFTDFIFETKIRMGVDANNDCTPEIGVRYFNYSNYYRTMLRGEITNDLSIKRLQEDNDLDGPVAPFDYSAGVYFRYKIVARGTTIDQYINDVLRLTWNDSESSITTGGIGLGNYGNNIYSVYYDDVRIRKYDVSDQESLYGFEQNQFAPLHIIGNVTPVSCFGGSNGAVNITVTGGDGTYTYLWSPGGQTSEDLTGMPAGTYSVHVLDGNGPMGDASFTITQPQALTLSYTITEPYTCAAGTATVQITAQGGTGPYSGTEPFQQGIGTQSHTVTDAHGCQASISVTVEPVSPWLSGSGWQYRDSVKISNPGGTALTNYQVHIGLNETFDFSKTNAGGSDIRFTSSDGSTQLSYWIETWSPATDTASIWVKVPTISTTGTTLYMYYGNNAAPAASNGTATFRFFDDFGTGNIAPGYWVWQEGDAHDWKYSAEMQEGALYYSITRAQNGWGIESLDSEIENEFNYIHLRLNPDGTINAIGSEPQYCYGILLSNLALGYMYFQTSNPTLAERCYNDMILVYTYARDTYQNVIGLNDAGASSKALQGFANASKAFTAHGNTASASEATAIVQNYANTFVAAQNPADGSWALTGGIQEHMKRDIGLLMAYDVTGSASYLQSVNFNMEYVVPVFLESNGGLTWHGYGDISQPFFEVHQVWFMVATRMLYNRNSSYNYLTQGEAAWLFLTDNNYSGLDMYVHNYVNHYAFFCYRNVTSAGLFQSTGNDWKGSYETGAALWAMSLNYSWVSNKVSSYDGKTYNYLDMSVKHAKKSIDNLGYVGPTPSLTGNWVRSIQWYPSGYQPDVNLWTRVGAPVTQLVQENGNNILSLTGTTHSNHLVTDPANFDNFIFEARVLMTEDVSGFSDPEIGFHYTDLNNRYYTQMRGTGQNDLLLTRYQGGTQLVNNSVSYDYTADVYFNYKMAVAGNNIQLYLNNQSVMSYADNGSLLTGRIYLGGFGSYPVYYDNVRVREYAATEPVAVLGGTQFYDIQWTGLALSSDWNNAANWSTCTLPTAASNISINDAPYDPVISGNITCARLIVEPSANLTVNAGATLTAGSIIINSSGTSNSGSLINLGTVTGPVTYNRFLREGNNFGDRHLVSSPVGGQDIGDFISGHSSKIENVRVWNEQLAVWSPVTTGDFISGTGYSIYQTDGSDGYFSFTGTIASSPAPVVGTSPYAQSYEARFTLDPIDPWGETHTEAGYWASGRSWINYFGGGWNLLGNPFTSAMNSALFISTNLTDLDPSYQALYVYDGINGVYRYSAASVPGYPIGAAEHGSVIQAGQGFMVLANNYGVQFNFDPSMQIQNTGVILLKSASVEEPWPGLQLKVRYGQKESLTTVVYNSDMTTGLDPGYDVGQMSTYPDVEIYTSLVLKDNGVNFTRQALPVADSEKNIVAVGIDCVNGGEVTFSAFTVPLGNTNFWLEDRLTGIYTNLKNDTYKVILPAETYGTGRFFIISSANTPTGIQVPEAGDTDIRVWTSKNGIIIKGEVGEGSVCEIYDLRGLKILETELADLDLNTVELPSRLHGVFLVRVIDGVKVTTRKVAIL
jgi:hypothetical protein